jgi:hypothetical protein
MSILLRSLLLTLLTLHFV